jgi:hypothetical protein
VRFLDPRHDSTPYQPKHLLCAVVAKKELTVKFYLHEWILDSFCAENQRIERLAGMRQSFVTVGSLAGSAVASAVFFLSGASYITTFAAAIIPPCLALVWLTFAFRGELSAEAAADAAKADSAPAPSSTEAASEKKVEEISFAAKVRTIVTAFSPAYWQALTVVSILYFGRFDFTWVTLRAKAVRIPSFLTVVPRI